VNGWWNKDPFFVCPGGLKAVPAKPITNESEPKKQGIGRRKKEGAKKKKDREQGRGKDTYLLVVNSPYLR
jgi:hypothetical protein